MKTNYINIGKSSAILNKPDNSLTIGGKIGSFLIDRSSTINPIINDGRSTNYSQPINPVNNYIFNLENINSIKIPEAIQPFIASARATLTEA